jgi:hypothetical protein
VTRVFHDADAELDRLERLPWLLSH